MEEKQVSTTKKEGRIRGNNKIKINSIESHPAVNRDGFFVSFVFFQCIIERNKMERRSFMIVKIFADKIIIINHNHHKKSAFHFQELLTTTNQLRIINSAKNDYLLNKSIIYVPGDSISIELLLRRTLQRQQFY
jgi:hypothetical protein